LDLENSKGAHFVEARTGKSFIDFFTCFASMPIGMNHDKMLNHGFDEYLNKAATNKPSNSDIYTDAMATFVNTFHNIAVPEHFKYSFYVSGGALAVENALKTAFDWKYRQNDRKGTNVGENLKILHFKEAFHGRSGYTLSLTNTDPKKVKFFPKFDWPRVTNPKLRFPLTEEVLADVIKEEQKSIAQIKQAFTDNPHQIAAIIIEPIQGEGGDNHFRREFLQEIKEIAHENHALLIFDEVQTGMGLTGSWWAHESIGVIPDIMSFGKKMQVCGILVGPKIDEEPDNVFHVSSRINSTWGGNLVDMVRATRYLEIIEEENLVENAKQMGDVLAQKLESVASEYPEHFYNVRGRGLFAALDMKSPDMRTKFINQCFDEGLIILPCGSNAVRFRPPLNITKEEINEGFEVIAKTLKKIL
jgi:L-lysine 6-transaminase